ncbi:MAG: exonuclease SbcCD subunit D [Campylobacterales bacterium]|nr:exonuclease SbcCD subunit D [Campylobacterales bacterium]
MKLVHFSDTHLGFNDLDIVNEYGVNQREVDFYEAFAQAVDKILDIAPDYVLHTGDLFHRPHPSNRAISFCLSQLKRLSAAKIKTIIIAGNHSTPRTKSSSPILAALRSLDFVYPVFDERYESIAFDDIVFHCIPHIHDEAKNLEAIDECEAVIDTSKRNIMLLHCSVGNAYMMEEYGERVYPKDKEYLFERMDYVALGHWHGFGKVGKHDNVFYSGSTERTSGADARNEKGFAVVELREGALSVSFEPIDIRPSHKISVDAESDKDIFVQLEAVANSLETDGALLYIAIQNLTASQSIDISNKEIEAIFPTALSVQISRKFKSITTQNATESVSSATLQEFFSMFLKEQCKEDTEFARLDTKVNALFAHYDEVNGDS